MTGRWVDVEIGGPDWLALITASKVAAILGVSKYDSPRSMWHAMHGDTPRQAQKREMSRGHYLEPGILAWFFDQHPELTRIPLPAGTFVNDWKACSPDALATTADGDMVAVEAKSAAEDGEFGKAGTDEIPTMYAGQCMWTAHLLGLSRVYVPMIGPYLEFAEYVVDYDPTIGAAIEAKCSAFRDSLTNGQPPPLDDHVATYQSLRLVHSNIEDRAVELPDEDALTYLRAKAAVAEAEAAVMAATSRLADRMGTAKKATWAGQTIAARQNSSTGVPFLKAAKHLPKIGATA